MFDKPVMFPPGRARLSMSLVPTGRHCHEHDRYRLSRTLRCERRQSRHCKYDVNLQLDEFISIGLKALRLLRRKAIFQYASPAFNVASVLQSQSKQGEGKLLFFSVSGVP
jgi:hypothetical protein